MLERFRSQVGLVFWVSLAFSVVFVLWGTLSPGNLGTVFDATLGYVVSTFGWVYLIAVSGFLVFVAYLAFSGYGKIRLGRDDERPEFSTVAWISMLFAAGVGLSFLFWGVAEPASHLGETPYGLAEPNTPEAANLSLQYTFFHWGLHPWAVYAVVGMAIAYFSFRKGAGSLISETLRPVFGARVDGVLGKTVDVLSIVAVLFGVATALGIGALQMNGGLSYVFGLPEESIPVRLVVIGVLTVAYLISAATGLDRGIKILSLVNMTLALILMLFVLFTGPTVFLMEMLTSSVGRYLGELAPMSLRTASFGGGAWAEQWTLFYWAWWVSWAPFVGTFIARISRGRTIRQFVLGVILAPTLLSFLWFAILGGTAINLDLFENASIAQTATSNLPQALFDTLNALPFGTALSLVALALVSIFFVTSADSATFVLGSMSTGGSENPSALVKLTWGVVIALFASVLLVGGGLQALQTATITAAVPFAFVMVFLCLSLHKALKAERRSETPPSTESPDQTADRADGVPSEPAPSRRG